MNPRVKKLWVDALRSGKYEQGRDQLRSSDGARFCCLGVLCDLYAKEHEVKWSRKLSFGADNAMPSLEVLTWAGLMTGHPMASMNDRGASFNEIAGYIEAKA